MVPKTETIERKRQKTITKVVQEEVTRKEIVKNRGKYVQIDVVETVKKEVEVPLFEEHPLYDSDGNEIGIHKIPIMETYKETIEVLDEEGRPILVKSGKFKKKERKVVSKNYDPNQTYVPREERPEWNCVGLLGQIPLRKGQPTAPSWIKIKDLSDKVELWLVK